MNTGIVRVYLILAAIALLGGCSSTSLQPADASNGRPIISAAEAQAMIRVEVKIVEPQPDLHTVVAATN